MCVLDLQLRDLNDKSQSHLYKVAWKPRIEIIFTSNHDGWRKIDLKIISRKSCLSPGEVGPITPRSNHFSKKIMVCVWSNMKNHIRQPIFGFNETTQPSLGNCKNSPEVILTNSFLLSRIEWLNLILKRFLSRPILHKSQAEEKLSINFCNANWVSFLVHFQIKCWRIPSTGNVLTGGLNN